MKTKNGIMATLLLGHVFYGLAILFSGFLIYDFDWLLALVVDEKPLLLAIVPLLFLGLGFWIVARYGSDDSWTRIFIGYVTGFLFSFVLLSLLVVVFGVEIPSPLLRACPYLCILIAGFLSVCYVSNEKTKRFSVYGFYGTGILLAYQITNAYLPDSIILYLQFILLVPLLLLAIKPKKTT